MLIEIVSREKPGRGRKKMERYLPVPGCEECEFLEEACLECILYGEAKKEEKEEEK